MVEHTDTRPRQTDLSATQDAAQGQAGRRGDDEANTEEPPQAAHDGSLTERNLNTESEVAKTEASAAHRNW